MTFVPADASVDELREAVANWQRNYQQAVFDKQKAVATLTASFKERYDWAMHERDVQQARAEQAERERDEATNAANRAWNIVFTAAGTNDPDLAEARLAKVPALVEALRKIETMTPYANPESVVGSYLPHGPVVGIARAALAAHERVRL